MHDMRDDPMCFMMVEIEDEINGLSKERNRKFMRREEEREKRKC